MFNIAVVYFNSDNELYYLDVEYGVSALKRNDNYLSVHKIVESNIQTEITDIACENPNMIVIFLSYNCYDLLLELSYKLKYMLDDVFIVVCHSLASCLAEPLLKDIRYIDVSAIGEYENTLLELSVLVKKKKTYKMCKGIAYIKDGEYVITNGRELSKIGSIAYPQRVILPNDARFFHVSGSRGCEGKCLFCDRNILFKICGDETPRFRDIDDVIKEVDFLVERYNCKFISFSDSTFCSASNIIDRLVKLYNHLTQKSYWIQFSISLRAELITSEVVMCMNKLKEVGLGKIFIGVESFNESDLKLYGKLTNVKSNINAITLLRGINSSDKDYYVKIECGFINFNPYSNAEGLKNNLVNLRKYNVHINPYLISSKLTLNYLSNLTKVVDRDNLFTKDINQLTVKELMSKSFNYHCINTNVQDINDIVSSCYEKLKLRNTNGSEIIRNRYYHFYGYDNVVKIFDKAYREWLSKVNDFSCSLFEYIIYSGQEYNEKLFNAISMCDEFEKQFIAIDNNLRLTQQRAVIQLKKIDELIYYKLTSSES